MFIVIITLLLVGAHARESVFNATCEKTLPAAIARELYRGSAEYAKRINSEYDMTLYDIELGNRTSLEMAVVNEFDLLIKDKPWYKEYLSCFESYSGEHENNIHDDILRVNLNTCWAKAQRQYLMNREPHSRLVKDEFFSLPFSKFATFNLTLYDGFSQITKSVSVLSPTVYLDVLRLMGEKIEYGNSEEFRKAYNQVTRDNLKAFTTYLRAQWTNSTYRERAEQVATFLGIVTTKANVSLFTTVLRVFTTVVIMVVYYFVLTIFGAPQVALQKDSLGTVTVKSATIKLISESARNVLRVFVLWLMLQWIPNDDMYPVMMLTHGPVGIVVLFIKEMFGFDPTRFFPAPQIFFVKPDTIWYHYVGAISTVVICCLIYLSFDFVPYKVLRTFMRKITSFFLSLYAYFFIMECQAYFDFHISGVLAIIVIINVLFQFFFERQVVYNFTGSEVNPPPQYENGAIQTYGNKNVATVYHQCFFPALARGGPLTWMPLLSYSVCKDVTTETPPAAEPDIRHYVPPEARRFAPLRPPMRDAGMYRRDRHRLPEKVLARSPLIEFSRFQDYIVAIYEPNWNFVGTGFITRDQKFVSSAHVFGDTVNGFDHYHFVRCGDAQVELAHPLKPEIRGDNIMASLNPAIAQATKGSPFVLHMDLTKVQGPCLIMGIGKQSKVKEVKCLGDQVKRLNTTVLSSSGVVLSKNEIEIKHNCSTVPGCSGAPLFDEHGHVFGVHYGEGLFSNIAAPCTSKGNLADANPELTPVIKGRTESWTSSHDSREDPEEMQRRDDEEYYRSNFYHPEDDYSDNGSEEDEDAHERFRYERVPDDEQQRDEYYDRHHNSYEQDRIDIGNYVSETGLDWAALEYEDDIPEEEQDRRMARESARTRNPIPVRPKGKAHWARIHNLAVKCRELRKAALQAHKPKVSVFKTLEKKPAKQVKPESFAILVERISEILKGSERDTTQLDIEPTLVVETSVPETAKVVDKGPQRRHPNVTPEGVLTALSALFRTYADLDDESEALVSVDEEVTKVTTEVIVPESSKTAVKVVKHEPNHKKPTCFYEIPSTDEPDYDRISEKIGYQQPSFLKVNKPSSEKPTQVIKLVPAVKSAQKAPEKETQKQTTKASVSFQVPKESKGKNPARPPVLKQETASIMEDEQKIIKEEPTAPIVIAKPIQFRGSDEELAQAISDEKYAKGKLEEYQSASSHKNSDATPILQAIVKAHQMYSGFSLKELRDEQRRIGRRQGSEMRKAVLVHYIAQQSSVSPKGSSLSTRAASKKM